MPETKIRTLAPNVDLVYSADDGGWYLARYPDGATSQLFQLERLAIIAFDRHEIRWS